MADDDGSPAVERATAAPRWAVTLAAALFFGSGASGLVYQVVWVRQMGQVLGNTLQSASLVTAVFMCGLGVGSLLAGRWVDRHLADSAAGPVRLYGLAEAAIGLSGLLLAWLLPRLPAALSSLSSYRRGAQGWFELSAPTLALHYALTIAALALPCLLMGATLTLLVRFAVRGALELAGWRVGLLYGMNTAGAALGALLTDFALVPLLGIARSQLVAVAINFAAAAGALWLFRALQSRSRAHGREPAPPASQPASTSSHRKLVGLTALALLLGGVTAMGIEIVWFRYLSQILGSLRATFSLMLATMLSCMWLGSLLGGFIERRLRHAAGWLIGSQAVLVMSTVGLLGLVNHGALHARHAEAIRDRFAAASGLWQQLIELWVNLRPIIMVTALPALLMGFAYPLANAHVQRNERAVGSRAGALYLATTAGNVLGSVLTGFVLLPALGIRGSAALLLAVATAGLVPLLASIDRPAERSTVTRGDLVSAAALLTAALAVVSFVALMPNLLLRAAVPSEQQGTRRTIAVSEGPYETIAITETPGLERTLFTNGHSMSSTSATAQRYMRAFAHLPLLQLAAPRRVLVICFGVGNTLHAASLHPSVERLESADLSRNILRHAGSFGQQGGAVLGDPRLQIYVDDGRHHLLMQPPDSYDLVTLEPPPIAFAGVAALYSREFYELVRSRLGPDGFITQWLPAYQVPGPTVLAMVRAFIDVFPQSVLLSGDDRELILMGTRRATIAMDPAAVEARIAARPAVRRDLRAIGLDSLLEIAGSFAASAETLRRATRGVPPVTDDRPLLEYSKRSGLRATRIPAELFAPREVERWCPGCLGRIARLRDYLRVRTLVYRSDAFRLAGHFLPGGEPAPLDVPDDAATRAVIEQSGYLKRLLGGPGYDAMVAGRAHLSAGRLSLARVCLRRAVFLDSRNAEALELLGRVYLKVEDNAVARVALERSVQADPGRSSAHLLLGALLARSGQRSAAIEHYRHAVALDPSNADAHFDLGVQLSRAGDKAAAEAELTRTLALQPHNPRANAVLCRRAASAKRFDEARRRCQLAQRGGVHISPKLAARLAEDRPRAKGAAAAPRADGVAP